MKTITIFFFLALFLLLKPFELNSGYFWYPDDDYDYFAHASSIAYGQFPHYEKEFFKNKGLPLCSVGSGILASPFVFAFSLIDRISHADIVQTRTYKTILHSWSIYGFFVSSIFYFWLGCALLHKGLRLHFPSRITIWAILLMILCQGLPLFAFRRPVFSHSFEFFLQSTMVYLFLKSMKMQWTWKDFSLKKSIVIGLLCGLITLVRYNNILIAMVWPLILARADWRDIKKHKLWLYLGTVFGVITLMILFFKVWPETFVQTANSYLSPEGHTFQRLSHIQSPLFYMKRALTVLFGLDWGLVFTAPFACITLITMFRPKSDIDKKLLWLLAPLIVNLYCIFNWGTQGGWYGYRYIIASLFPLLVYPFAKHIENIDKLPTRSWRLLLITVLASLPVLSMICFEANGGYFNLSNLPNAGWGNQAFQHQVWKMFLFNPSTLVDIILATGPAYIVYIIKYTLFGLHLSLKPYFDEYPAFDPLTLIKMIFLYALPFLLHFCWLRSQKNRSTEAQPNE